MSVNLTPEEARAKRLCPNSAIMGTENMQTPFCHGHQCGAWRWAADDIFRAAVAKQAAVDGEKAPFKLASSKVAAKPVSFGLRGYCGLGGQP